MDVPTSYSRFPRDARATSDSEESESASLWSRTRRQESRRPRRRPCPWNTIAASSAISFVIFCLVSVFLTRFWWRVPKTSGKQGKYADTAVRFSHFEGAKDCGISLSDIYKNPFEADTSKAPFCKTRDILLEALSGGGRHGFDAPFTPQGCHYRWFDTDEICMILERFDGVVFVGDEMIRHIYTAFNILLREDLALGGLERWRMNEQQRASCRCDHQFTKLDCYGFTVSASEMAVLKRDEGKKKASPAVCQRTPHLLIPLAGTPAPTKHILLENLIIRNPRSYRPVPIIHSFGLSGSLSWETATAFMDEWIETADATKRVTPFLWVGPTAAGYLKPPSQILTEGNNALWHYTVEMGKEAKKRGSDVLNMYNLTLQASSWNGSGYGERVSLVQAMMIINWLSRLETS